MWLQRIAAWWEECNLVYDDPTIANEHQENEQYSRIRKTEYLVTKHYYF